MSPIRILTAVTLVVFSVAAFPAVSLAQTNLEASVSGSTVSFRWAAAAGASGYRIEAGSSPGLSNLANLDIGATSTYVVPNVPNGVYYVRLRAVGGGRLGAPSNEVIVTVGAVVPSGSCAAPPETPTGLRGNIDVTLLTLSWTPASTGCAPTAYIVRAGSSEGAANIAQVSVAAPSLSANVPDGLYFISVVATNAFGASAPTGSLVVPVAAPTASGRVGFNTATPAIWPDEYGNAVLIGEVVNRSLSAAVFVRVIGDVRNSAGQTVATASTYLRGQTRRLSATGLLDDSALGPGEIGCFYVQTNVPIGSVSNALLQATWDSYPSTAARNKVETLAVDGGTGAPSVTVTAINRGPTASFYNIATVYMKQPNGHASGCDFVVSDESLAAGQTSAASGAVRAPSTIGTTVSWMQWTEAGDPLAGLAAQTFQSMRNSISAGAKREAQVAWESLQQQRHDYARRVGR